jgi:hypothetical protein
MSLKSLITASLLCLVSSAGFAAPTLTISGSRNNTGTLGVSPARVWNVAAGPDLTLENPAALALELGFEATGGRILSVSVTPNMAAAAPAPARVLYNNNSGEVIFGWETLTDIDPGPEVNMKPVGIQLGTGSNANEAIAFIGTNLFSTATAKDLITITTESSVTALAWGGRYNADGSMAAVTGELPGLGRIVQGNGTPTSGTNYHEISYAGSRASITGPHFLGDMNGDGKVTNADTARFGIALTQPFIYKSTYPDLNILRADINSSGAITSADVSRFGEILNGRAFGAGSSLPSASVPEPASIALVSLAFTCFAGVRRRGC